MLASKDNNVRTFQKTIHGCKYKYLFGLYKVNWKLYLNNWSWPRLPWDELFQQNGFVLNIMAQTFITLVIKGAAHYRLQVYFYLLFVLSLNHITWKICSCTVKIVSMHTYVKCDPVWVSVFKLEMGVNGICCCHVMLCLFLLLCSK